LYISRLDTLTNIANAM